MRLSSFILPLWDAPPPNHLESGLQELREADDRLIRISQVQAPAIEVRLPARGNSTGQAVVICPGGGYGFLAYDWEGTDIAGWLNGRGIAAVVLKYRLPVKASNVVPRLSPLLDAKRALRLTRHHAEDWGVDPRRIGVMGFSAGGHLASTLGTRFDAGDPDAADPVERCGSRPDFMILAYPVITMADGAAHAGSRQNLLGDNPPEELRREYSSELHVTRTTPPTFLVHAGDDALVSVRNSLLFHAALVARGVPAELHVYPSGGHGFSLAIGQGRLQGWTRRCAEWLAEKGR